MIGKTKGIIVTGALAALLAACNNNNAMDLNDDNQLNPVDVSDNVNYGSRGYGPLTRDMGVRNNNNGRYNRNNDNQNQAFDFNGNRNNNNEDISSLTTDMSSKKYPHTRAIAVQDAKFKFIQANNKEDAQRQAQQYIQQFRQQAGVNQGTQQGQKGQNQAQAPNQKQNVQQQTQAPAQAQQQPAGTPDQKQNTQQQTQGISQVAQRVIELTNAERRRNGLPELKGDTQLSGVAQKKSEDMRQNNYFSHTSPTYGSPFDMMRDFGVDYKTAGENIAQGQQTPEKVVQAWMNSEGHRKNILSKDFTHIGIGYDQNGHHWTQMFIGK